LTSILEAEDLTGCYLISLNRTKALSLEHRSFLHLTEILELLHLMFGQSLEEYNNKNKNNRNNRTQQN